MSPDKQLTLAQMQSWLQSALLRQHGQKLLLAPELLINESSRLSAARHLSIYRQSYLARLRECMQNQFSALAYALGEELFQMFADGYLDAYPSGSYTLNDLGAQFPRFLAETRPDAAHDEKESWIDFIIELAQFEYTLSVIFDDYAGVDLAIADEQTPDENLKLAPLFRLFYHRYPVCRYYLDATRRNAPELPFEEDTYAAVTRTNYRLRLLELTAPQYHFLERMLSGDSVAQAREYFIKVYGFDAERMAHAWQQWRVKFINAGFFSVG